MRWRAWAAFALVCLAIPALGGVELVSELRLQLSRLSAELGWVWRR